MIVYKHVQTETYYRARLVEPGVAEVVFVKMSDAAKAVEIYHNRQLDGKPMKCSVVQER